MKELTIEEKAKAYDEALERASKLRFQNPFDTVSQMMEHVFPELKESDDEIIRKELLSFCQNRADNYPNDPKYANIGNWIAWLAKQGKSNPYSGVSFEYNGNIWGMCARDNGVDIGLNGELIQHVNIEKQNEKKHLDISESIEKTVSDAQPTFDFNIGVSDECLYDEAISDNESKPKFKVGDFIANDYCFGKVIEITNDAYLLDTGQGIPFSCEHNAHLWTITDAKDGDVLCYKDEISLYKYDIKDWSGTSFGGFVYYCCYDGKRFITDSFYSLTEQDKTDIHPATKEQCDLLFQKMKEAGYEWDAEKKELKEIEQNLASSEKVSKDDTLLDLLNKMPSCITVDGIDYHFVMKKTIAYMAFYEGEGEGSGKVIFWTAGDPIELLTAMLNKLKEEGLLE